MRGNKQSILNYVGKQGFLLLFVVLGFCVLLSVAISSCTKPAPDQPVLIDTTTPPPSGPSGNIQEFSVRDTLVGYERQTLIKWYVSGTNSLTEVRLNGVKVAFSDAMQSGPLTSTTVFTLSINNNKQQSKTVRVADSITTLLWNDNKRWITTTIRTRQTVIVKDINGADSTTYVWAENFDASKKDYYRDFRTGFNLNGTSKEEQVTTRYPQPPPSGVFHVLPWFDSVTGYGLQWKLRQYRIDTLTLSNKELVLGVNIDSLGIGRLTYNRIRYTPEF